MLSTLYAIAALLIVLALPYLIAFWTIRHTPMRYMRIQPAAAQDVPEHLKAVFKQAIAELRTFLGKKIPIFERRVWRSHTLLSKMEGFSRNVLRANPLAGRSLHRLR